MKKNNQLLKFAAMSLSVFNLSHCECMDIPPTVSISNTSSVRLEVLQQTNIDMAKLASANQDDLQQMIIELQKQNALKSREVEELKRQNDLRTTELSIEQGRIAAIAQRENVDRLEATKIIRQLEEQRKELARREIQHSQSAPGWKGYSENAATIITLKASIATNENRLRIYMK